MKATLSGRQTNSMPPSVTLRRVRRCGRVVRLTETFIICLLCLSMGLAQVPVRPATTDEPPAAAAARAGDKPAFPLMIEPDSGTYFPYDFKPGWTPLVGDPLSSASAEYRNTWPLFSLGGVLPLQVSLLYAPDLYNRTIATDGLYQMGGIFIDAFTTDAVYRLIEFEETGVSKPQAFINVLLKDDTFVFLDKGGQFVPSEGKFQISRQGDYYYLMDPVTELIYIFRSRVKNTTRHFQFVRRMGEAVVIMDRNGNSLRFTYNADNNPTLIEDGLGRRLVFTYKDHVLESVSDGQGRTYTFAYANSELASFTDPAGQATRFEYDPTYSNLLRRYIRPAGNSPITQTWKKGMAPLIGWQVGSVTSQTDALQNTLALSYDPNKEQLTANFPDSTQMTYESVEARYPEKVTDAAGHATSYTYNFANMQVTKITDRIGDSTQLTYDPLSGYVSSVKNTEGQTTKFTYTAQNQSFTNPIDQTLFSFTFSNLTQVEFPDGAVETYTHDGKGNRLTYTDAAGKVRTYTYNSKGQILTATNALGGVTTYTYNADGTIASMRDSETGGTTFDHDQFRRMNKITHADGKSIQFTYGANGRMASLIDENNRTYTLQYDANGNLAKVTDPKGKFTQYTYDAMDRLSRMIDRLGNATSYTFDSRGRLASYTDPAGLAMTFGYDPRGWFDRVTRGTSNWRNELDDEGKASASVTPLGHKTQYSRNKLGEVIGVTDPLGNSATFTRDAGGRITEATDPLGNKTTINYDVRGNPVKMSRPAIGQAEFQWNDANVLSGITDPNGKAWTFDWTSMERPLSQTDPLGNKWTMTYDTLGRPLQDQHSDGTSMTRTYDATGNLTRVTYSGGPDYQYTYDELNQLLTTPGVALTRDAEGQVTSTNSSGTNFGATYDQGGRLKTASYNNGALVVTYTYDAVTGMLTKVEDNVTHATVSFSYDADGRLTGITRSNGVNATLTRDDADRLTGIKEGAFMNLEYTLDKAGRVTEEKMTVPLDPAPLLTPGARTLEYDDASQVKSPGYSYDQRGQLVNSLDGTFTWDSASNLTSINQSATFTYDGLGSVETRRVGNETTRFFHNYAIPDSPIVGEKTEGGQFQRFYVWTPDGRLLYMVDAAHSNKVYFYHFDRVGSTLALTNSQGAVTDSYAYEPFGQLLKHEGTNPQPFTFVGQLGVRHEDSLSGHSLYEMGVRYYDPGTQRFINREPMWPDVSDIRRLNPYQYALNDPLSFVDFSGTDAGSSTVIEQGGKPLAGRSTVLEGTKRAWEAADTVLEKKLASTVIERKAGETLIREGAPKATTVVLKRQVQHIGKTVIQKSVFKMLNTAALARLGLVATTGPVGFVIIAASFFEMGFRIGAAMAEANIIEKENQLKEPPLWAQRAQALDELAEMGGIPPDDIDPFLQWLIPEYGGHAGLENDELFAEMVNQLLFWAEFAQIKPPDARQTSSPAVLDAVGTRDSYVVKSGSFCWR